jgi:hypothetical protein
MHQDERGYLIVPREIAIGADCTGCLIIEKRGDVVDLKCDSRGAVVDAVPIDLAGTRLMELASAEMCSAERLMCFAASVLSKRSSARNAAKG